MDGITIIEEITHHPHSIGNIIVVCLLLTAIAVLGIVVLLGNKATTTSVRIAQIIATVLVCLLIVCIWVVEFSHYNQTTTRYKVTIDDTVSYNEFTSKYNVIKKDGNVYLVEEIE